MQSQADGKTQTCFAGEEDAHSEEERSSVDGNAAADLTDVATADHGEDDGKKVANTEENQENIQPGYEATVPAKQEDPHNTNRSEADPNDWSERTESISPLCATQEAAVGETSESEKKQVSDPDGEDIDPEDDLGVPEVPQISEEEVEVKEKKDLTGRKAIEEDDLEIFSADPDVDSVIRLSKRSARFRSIKRDKQTRKQEALKYQKVLQLVLSAPPPPH